MDSINITNVIGRTILHFGVVESTMDVVWRFANRGEEEGLVVIADNQISGRGRNGKKWVSLPKCSLLMSILLRPAENHLHQMLPAAALAVCDMVWKIFRYKVSIKWPNDIVVSGRKLGGLLAESKVTPNGVITVLGIGLNLTNDYDHIKSISDSYISLASINHGKIVDKTLVISTLINTLEERRKLIACGDSLIHAWRAMLNTLGTTVTVSVLKNSTEYYVVTGYAQDVDNEGRLVLIDDSGKKHIFSNGQVTLT